MNRRCPGNKLVGMAVLRGWKWIINERGYGNVVISHEDLVYGLVYELTPEDEKNLDRWEGVPWAYTKHLKDLELQLEDGKETTIKGLVYIDLTRVTEGKVKEEYIPRMNMGIRDAAERGMPQWYIDKYLRKYIPAKNPVSVESKQDFHRKDPIQESEILGPREDEVDGIEPEEAGKREEAGREVSEAEQKPNGEMSDAVTTE